MRVNMKSLYLLLEQMEKEVLLLGPMTVEDLYTRLKRLFPEIQERAMKAALSLGVMSGCLVLDSQERVGVQQKFAITYDDEDRRSWHWSAIDN